MQSIEIESYLHTKFSEIIYIYLWQVSKQLLFLNNQTCLESETYINMKCDKMSTQCIVFFKFLLVSIAKGCS